MSTITPPTPNLWQKIIKVVVTVLTAIATTFATTSCMQLME